MGAIQEFWMSEDLLEQLLPMLDLSTTLALASVNPLAVSLLCRPIPAAEIADMGGDESSRVT